MSEQLAREYALVDVVSWLEMAAAGWEDGPDRGGYAEGVHRGLLMALAAVRIMREGS